MRKILAIVCLFLIPILVVTCTSNPGVDSSKPLPGMGETFAAYTMQAQLTQWAFSTLEAKLTAVSKPTAKPSKSPTPRKTGTPRSTSLSQQPQNPPVTSKCNWASYVKDVTIPDNTVLEPGQRFTKTWRFMNNGSCTWNTNYILEYSGGNQMGGPDEVPFSVNVPPGETIDVSVNLVAPNLNGNYIGYWLLRSDKGELFGIGGAGDGVFWVKIEVQEMGQSGSNIVYSFAENACAAGWSSGSGVIACPSVQNYVSGSVYTTYNPIIEGDISKTLPTLVMTPNDGSNGYITGIYPAFQINAGDRLRATIGCLSASPNCDVDFELSYIPDDGSTYTLGSWGQTLDAYNGEIDVDLSSLAGSTVKFVLKVYNNGSSADDRAFWMWPNIWR